MSCIQISGAPLNFAQPQPVTATITPAVVGLYVSQRDTFIGAGNSPACLQRYIANLGGTDVTIDGNTIPPLAAWTEKAELNAAANTYNFLPPISFDATGGRLFIAILS